MFATESIVAEFEGHLHGPISELSAWEIPVEAFRPNDILWYSRSYTGRPLLDLLNDKLWR